MEISRDSIIHEDDHDCHHCSPRVDLFPTAEQSTGRVSGDVDGSKAAGKRATVQEMDFFAKKENSQPPTSTRMDRARVPDLNLNKQIGLQVVTPTQDQAPTVSVKSKLVESEKLEEMREELAGAKEENQRLRELLSDVADKYGSLRAHFVKLLQERGGGKLHQAGSCAKLRASVEDEVNRRNHQLEEEEGGSAVARQFLDLRPALSAKNESHNTEFSTDQDNSSHTNLDAEEMEVAVSQPKTIQQQQQPADHEADGK